MISNKEVYISESGKQQGEILILSISVSLSILLILLFYRLTLLKGILLALSFFGIAVFFAYPELSVILAFSTGIFKEWLTTSVPVFQKFDFTITVYAIAFMAIFFSLLYNKKIFNIQFHKSFLPLALFTAFMVFTVLYTPSFHYGSLKAFSFLFFNWALFLFPILLIGDEKIAWRMIWIFAVLGTLVSGFTIYNLISKFLQGEILYAIRGSFLGANPISFAGWIGSINILLISILPSIKKSKGKIVIYLSIGIMLTAMVIANSRGPLLSFVLVGLIIFVKRAKHIEKKRLFIVLALILVIIVAIFSVLPPQLTNRYFDLFSKKPSGKNFDLYTVNTRLFAWKTAIKLATQNLRTFFFGTGNGGFSSAFYNLDVRLYPHNMFLEVFCELGILGLILLTWFFKSIVSESLKVMKTIVDKQYILLFAFFMAALFIFVAAQFSGDLNDNRRLWFFLGSLVALLNVHQIKSSS